MKRAILLLCIVLISDCFLPSRVLPQGGTASGRFKPASTNTFISLYPGVNPQTRQAIFRVVAPEAKRSATTGREPRHEKDENGVWWITTDPLVVGFHYYSIAINVFL